MPILTLKIKDICAGGGHLYYDILLDGKVVDTQSFNINEVLLSKEVSTVDTAVKTLITSTKATTLLEFKKEVEALSVSVKGTSIKS